MKLSNSSQWSVEYCKYWLCADNLLQSLSQSDLARKAHLSRFQGYRTVVLDSLTLAKSKYFSAHTLHRGSVNYFWPCPKPFADPKISCDSGCLMLSAPIFQNAELAHNHFLTLPKILRTLKKPVQGPCTPCWQLISVRI